MENPTSLITSTAKRFGISALKPYQLLVVQRILEQEESDIVRNQVVILPTGTGKSLCFLIPAVLCEGITVIVYPLLALMNDQISKLESTGIPSICIRGGQSKRERRELLSKLDTGTKIVVTTPESLKSSNVLNQLSRRKISLLVVDEAHVISKWGKEFRPAYMDLTQAVIRLKPHQTLAFTATASEQTLKDISRCLFFSKPLVVRGDADRPNIIYAAYPTLNRIQGTLELVRTCSKPAIVFCTSRPDTEALCKYIQMEERGLPVMYYHAGLSRTERESIEKWFMESQDGTLVATSAYGMGMDKAGIRTVIHYRLPSSVEEYLQESGRAGRDGQTSWAWVIVSEEERSTAPENPVLGVFTSHKCRRMALLSLMGQEKEECTGCDVCLKKAIPRPSSEKALLALVRNWPFRFNPLSAAYLLCSSRNQHFKKPGTRLNPLYGVLPGWNPRLLAETITYLANENRSFPVSCVRLKEHGDILYPSNNRLFSYIAKILSVMDRLHNWISMRLGTIIHTRRKPRRR